MSSNRALRICSQTWKNHIPVPTPGKLYHLRRERLHSRRWTALRNERYLSRSQRLAFQLLSAAIVLYREGSCAPNSPEQTFLNPDISDGKFRRRAGIPV